MFRADRQLLLTCSVLAVVIGAASGFASALFLILLDHATAAQTNNPWLLYLLPLLPRLAVELPLLWEEPGEFYARYLSGGTTSRTTAPKSSLSTSTARRSVFSSSLVLSEA